MAVVRGVLLCVLVCFVNATSHHEAGSVSQPSLLELLSTAVQDVNPCMVPCLLKDIIATYQTLLPCTNQTMTDITRFINDNNIQDYNDLYTKATAKTDGQPSPFCRFYDKSAACLQGAVTSLCGNGTAAHLQSWYSGIRAYANCQGDLLPVLQCALHPEMFRPMAGYMECVGDLVQEVNERYLYKNGMFHWDNFYNKAIIEDNGIGYRRLLTNFGSCLDTEISLVTGCGVMRGHVLPQIGAIRDFLDVNHKKGTDALVCLGNPVLNIVSKRCTYRLLEDIFTPSPVAGTWHLGDGTLLPKAAQQFTEHLGDGTLLPKAAQLFTEHLGDGTLLPKAAQLFTEHLGDGTLLPKAAQLFTEHLGDGTLLPKAAQLFTEHLGDGTLLPKAAQLFTEYLSNGTFDELWQEILLETRPHYLSYSACLKSATEQHCGYHWSTQEVIKINKPTDDFFVGLRPLVKGPDCGPLDPPVEPSGGTQHVPLWHLYMAVMMIVYVVQ